MSYWKTGRTLVLGTTRAVLTLGLLLDLTSQAAPPEKITICHAAGQDGTTHFIELNLSYNGAFGRAGHRTCGARFFRGAGATDARPNLPPQQRAPGSSLRGGAAHPRSA
jgi:hypothetical protein